MNMEKHSSGDLQSRLKTRKILGVGETDNGDIHRSKISQVLGHNEHLYVRFPKGMWTTHMVLSSLVTLEALILLFVPSLAGSLGLMPPHIFEANCPMTSVRLIGAALCGLSVFVWAVLGTTDKHYARTALLATVLYNALCVGIAVTSTLLQGSLCRGAVAACIGLRTSLCVLCLAYFQQIGEPWSGLPKSSSYKELTKEEGQARVGAGTASPNTPPFYSLQQTSSSSSSLSATASSPSSFPFSSSNSPSSTNPTSDLNLSGTASSAVTETFPDLHSNASTSVSPSSGGIQGASSSSSSVSSSTCVEGQQEPGSKKTN